MHSTYASKIRTAAHKADKSFFSVIDEVGKRDILNLPDEILSEAVDAAKGEEDFTQRFGDISFIPYLTPASSAVDVLATAAKKNCPFYLRIDPRADRDVRMSRHGVEVTCDEKDGNYIQTVGAKTEVEIYVQS